MELRLDLHIHSCHSLDGRMTPREIAIRAKERGLNGVAICDHDRVFPPEERRRVSAEFPDFLFIPGVEMSTEYGHLLGWLVTEEIQARAFPEIADEIHRQGGIAVLAHPFEHTKTTERLEKASPYLDGIEIWNSRADRKNRRANAMAAAFAAERGLRGFAGSDAHTPQEIGNGVTIIDADALTLEAVKAALLSDGVRTDGRRSKAIYVAASQWTRRRKSNASPISYCKWAAFAVKCLLSDAFRRDGAQ